MIILSEFQVSGRHSFARSWTLRVIISSYPQILKCHNNEIHRINKEYRGVDKPTDVISFAIEEEDPNEIPIILPDEAEFEIPKNIGDIMVSIDKVKEQAEYLGHSQERELGFLVVHGFLHLNGYDHMQAEDEKEMFGLQREILEAYGLKR